MHETDARRLLEDPRTTPEQLQQIATEYPALRPGILAHPNVYPGLAEWIIAQPPAAPATRPAGRPRAMTWIVASAGAVVLLAGGGVAAVALASSAGAPEALPSASTATAAPTRSSTPAPTATGGPSTVTVGEGWSVYGPVLYDAGFDNDMDFGASAPLTVRTPAGPAVDLDAAFQLPAADITGQSWTVATESRGVVAVGVVVVRNPAAGLDPESYSLDLVRVPLDGSAFSVTEIARSACSIDGSASVGGSPGSSVIVGWSEGTCDGTFEDTSHVVVWNTESRSTTWSRDEAWMAGNVYGAAAIEHEGTCDPAEIVNVATSAVTAAVSESDLRSGGSCTGGSARGDGIFLRYSETYSPEVPDFYYDGTGARITLPTADDIVRNNGGTVKIDPVTGYLAVPGYTSYLGDVDLTVWDPATGRTVYTLPAAQVEDLDASMVAFLDGWLYLSTSDENVAVDVATGTVVTRSVSGVAIEGVTSGDTPYVYLSDGTARDLRGLSSPLP